MEERCFVNSPRRILSFSKNRRTDVSFPDADDRSPTRFGVSGEHGPKLSEVYGFIGCITVVVATGLVHILHCFCELLFPCHFHHTAYVPGYWLHSIGIYYYPIRYWTLVVPTYVMATIVLAIKFYIGLKLMATPPPTSLKSMFDEYSKEPVSGIPSTNDDEQAIELISDISISQVDEMLII